MTECVNTGECQGLSVRTGGLGGGLGVRRRQPERKKRKCFLPPGGESDRGAEGCDALTEADTKCNTSRKL